MPPQERQLQQARYWYHVRRDDPAIFGKWLGSYEEGSSTCKCTATLLLPPFRGNPVELSLMVTNSQNLLQYTYQQCFGTTLKPLYQYGTNTGSSRDGKTTCTLPLVPGVPGQSVRVEVLLPHSARQYYPSDNQATMEAAAELALQTLEHNLTDPSIKVPTVRSYLSQMPFAIRFQMERLIWSEATIAPRLGDGRARGAEQRRLHKRAACRKLLLVLLQVLLPQIVLLELPTKSLTFIELFAERLWDQHLHPLPNLIEKGTIISVLALSQPMQHLMAETTSRLADIERRVGCKELDLDVDSATDEFVRSRWPLAEYKATFELDGTLAPTSLQMVNVGLGIGSAAYESRRALRQGPGWAARDQFVQISSVKFLAVYQRYIAQWLCSHPRMCGQRYQYLFDKGTGKPTLWLVSTDVNREEFLRNLGDFSKESPTKLGDRIGLTFTHTQPILQLDPHIQVKFIPEVVHNGYAFSDGYGAMGLEMAKRIQKVKTLKSLPSAVQIRLGGCKGMLSLKHHFVPCNGIGIRPSMVKFPSPHTTLEVKRVAQINHGADTKLFSHILLIMNYLMTLKRNNGDSHAGSGSRGNRRRSNNRAFVDLQYKACAEMALQYDTHSRLRRSHITSLEDYATYRRRVINHGLKENGQPFAPQDLSQLRSAMNESRQKVNLPCSLMLILGVADEHNVLEDGQLLAGNSTVTGEVWISRSPCTMPGSIRKAFAVPGFAEGVYLQNALVFSAKGDRPFPDTMAGGDLDGDEYYVIAEHALIERLREADPHDFGSQKSDHVMTLGHDDVFVTPSQLQVDGQHQGPSLEDQLHVFQDYLRLGDLVSKSSDAWARVTDKESPGSKKALQMAELHNLALDARKLAMTPLDHQDVVAKMENTLKKYPIPLWKPDGHRARHLPYNDTSTSILGVLHHLWSSWITRLDETIRLRQVQATGQVFLMDDASIVSASTEASRKFECVICLTRAAIQCPICSENVFYCSDLCGRDHNEESGHVTSGPRRPQRLRREHDSSELASVSEAGAPPSLVGMIDRSSIASTSFSYVEVRSTMQDLADIVFDRKRLSRRPRNINFRELSFEDLQELAQLQFQNALRAAEEDCLAKQSAASYSHHTWVIFFSFHLEGCTVPMKIK
jgi:hypothetical protein